MREDSWHRHPIDNPEIHNGSEKASKSINIIDFIEEVKEILIQKDLI